MICESVVSKLKLTALCSIFNQNGLSASVEGDDRVVHAVNTLQDACDGEISFLSNPKYVQAATETKASAVIVKEGMTPPTDNSVIRCSDPYAGVTLAITLVRLRLTVEQYAVTQIGITTLTPAESATLHLTSWLAMMIGLFPG